MPGRRRGGGRRREARAARPERDLSQWVPKTKLGRLVLAGTLTTLGDALKTGLPIREPEIVDVLLPETEDEVLDVNMVQRMTDSGRRVNFVITCIVGNKDGFAGLGRARGREVGPSIRRAIDNAKLNMIEIRRGCGSWECGCQRAHSLPFKVMGRSGSVVVVLKPAPQGVGLAVGDVAKSVLRLGGITDAWGFTKGHTKTTVNYALATFEALRRTSELKVRREQTDRLKIKAGAEQVFVRKIAPAAVPEPEAVPELPEEIAVEGEDLTQATTPEAGEEGKEE
ncbi:MAG: 30S ribosomal protein S5 [Methanobacteriota archaeon]|nr:MAG: 30S ribosomal protein S5 [Euryarchaeota archaeon]